MKSNLNKLLLACVLSLSLLATANIAEAYNCKYVRGHYNSHGYWVPKQKVCYNTHYQCKWVRGYYNKYGHWVPKHKVCWH